MLTLIYTFHFPVYSYMLVFLIYYFSCFFISNTSTIMPLRLQHFFLYDYLMILFHSIFTSSSAVLLPNCFASLFWHNRLLIHSPLSLLYVQFAFLMYNVLALCMGTSTLRFRFHTCTQLDTHTMFTYILYKQIRFFFTDCVVYTDNCNYL